MRRWPLAIIGVISLAIAMGVFTRLSFATPPVVPPAATSSQWQTSVFDPSPPATTPRSDRSSAAARRPPSPTRERVRFLESFDGDLANPQPWSRANWDVAVHSRDEDTWQSLEVMDAHHGPDCSAPMQTHRIHAYSDAVYSCRDHVMTAINASGYGAIYLTPDHMVDFSDGEAVVRFDVSTLRTSKRDWIDVWITPYDDNLQAPLEGFLPDLAGPPRNAVQVRMNDANGDGTMLQVNVYREHEDVALPGRWWVGYESWLTPDAKRRDTFELSISRDHIRVGMPDYGQWWVDEPVDLDWTLGVVQLGHHSYNPAKEAKGTANTWHWDNVEISPAKPFTIIHADRRFVDPSSSPAVTFDRAAPADAHLRFSAMAEGVDVSFDGGATWEPAKRPSQAMRNGLLFSNYWTPVPEGTQDVHVRGHRGWLPSWIAKDFSVWSPEPVR